MTVNFEINPKILCWLTEDQATQATRDYFQILGLARALIAGVGYC